MRIDPKRIFENSPEGRRALERYQHEQLGGARLQPTLPGLERIPLDYDLCGACYGRGCNLCDYEGVVLKNTTFGGLAD